MSPRGSQPRPTPVTGKRTTKKGRGTKHRLHLMPPRSRPPPRVPPRPAPSAWLHPATAGIGNAFGYKRGRGGICTLSIHLLGPEPPHLPWGQNTALCISHGTSSHLSVSQPHSYPPTDRVWGGVLRGATAWTSPISTLTAHEVTRGLCNLVPPRPVKSEAPGVGPAAVFLHEALLPPG